MMPSLIDHFTNLITRLRPAQPKTTSDEIRPASISSAASIIKLFQVEQDRRSIVSDCRQMYDLDTRAEGVIATLARDAIKGGFTVNVKKGNNTKKAQTIATDLMTHLNLITRLDDWVRLTLRDGDSFLELSVDKSGLIQQVTRKPTLQIHRNSNNIDRFTDPTQAYWLGDEAWLFQPGPDAIWFADWQIVHARWKHDEGSRYGRPLFASARKAWKRMSEGETDIAVRRKTRAGMKYLHVIEGDETAVETYQRQNKDTLRNPFAAIADFFVNKKATIQAIQGDARLGEIDDVLHHIETWAVASPVPLALIGYGKDLNRDILEQKLEQYERALEPVTQWVIDQLLKPLIETQWLLQGIWPGGMEYDIIGASKKTLTAEALGAAAEAGLKLRALGWPDEVIIETLAPLIPGLDAEALLAAMKTAQANQPDEVDRIAAMAGQ